MTAELAACWSARFERVSPGAGLCVIAGAAELAGLVDDSAAAAAISVKWTERAMCSTFWRIGKAGRPRPAGRGLPIGVDAISCSLHCVPARGTSKTAPEG